MHEGVLIDRHAKYEPGVCHPCLPLVPRWNPGASPVLLIRTPNAAARIAGQSTSTCRRAIPGGREPGTVVVPCGSAFCIEIWLPRRLTSTKPWTARIRQTSRPERTRSLANRDLDVGHVDLAAKAPCRSRRRMRSRRTASTPPEGFRALRRRCLPGSRHPLPGTRRRIHRPRAVGDRVYGAIRCSP